MKKNMILAVVAATLLCSGADARNIALNNAIKVMHANPDSLTEEQRDLLQAQGYEIEGYVASVTERAADEAKALKIKSKKPKAKQDAVVAEADDADDADDDATSVDGDDDEDSQEPATKAVAASVVPEDVASSK